MVDLGISKGSISKGSLGMFERVVLPCSSRVALHSEPERCTVSTLLLHLRNYLASMDGLCVIGG